LELVIYNMIGKFIYREHFFAAGWKEYFKYFNIYFSSALFL
jgi:hypothetical protein